MRKSLVLFAGLALILSACGGGEEKKTIDAEATTEAGQETTSFIDFNIPSPSEQFALISKMDVVKNTKGLHNPDAADSYNTSAQKALNFGVYTADVAYLTSFNETNKYLTYFGKLEKLGNDIGVAKVFGTELGELAKKWDGNADSLFRLSDETYNKTFQRLIEIDKGNELSLMLVGGWIESMHLMLGSSKGYGKSPKLEKAVVDQKLVAENLFEFLVSYQDNEDVAAYAKEIESVLKVYEEMDCSSSETKVENANGKLNFSGGEECRLTEKCFNDLKTRVEAIRTKIISNK
ncbi:MAG TPA: hypothetical protein VK151_02945 [Fluviicola sp.]|nr:hypothetical protein [Fluviicola sp.]